MLNKTNQDLITDICSICVRINTSTRHAAFFEYSGHVETVQVHISKNKHLYNQWILERRIYWLNQTQMTEELQALKKTVQRFLP